MIPHPSPLTLCPSPSTRTHRPLSLTPQPPNPHSRQIRRETELTESGFDKEKGEERVAALGGGIARIKVGAATETELKDKKLRYEDALNAVKSALECGIVPGGGAAMVHLCNFEKEIKEAGALVDTDEDFMTGIDIVFKCLTAPMMQVLSAQHSTTTDQLDGTPGTV